MRVLALRLQDPPEWRGAPQGLPGPLLHLLQHPLDLVHPLRVALLLQTYRGIRVKKAIRSSPRGGMFSNMWSKFSALLALDTALGATFSSLT